MNIILYPLIFMLSLSLRTPNKQPNPLDYEVATGIEVGQGVKIWTWYEREAGKKYTGLDGKLAKRISNIEFAGYFKNKQAQNILRGGISTTYIVKKYMRFGLSQVWDHYEPATCFEIGTKTKYFDTRALIYQEGIESLEANIYIAIPINKNIEIKPTFSGLVDRNKNRFIQAKLIFKFRK